MQNQKHFCFNCHFAAWFGIVLFGVYMLVSSAFFRLEARFNDDITLITSELKRDLESNETVMASFTAYVQAVDRGDPDSMMWFASSVAKAHPHIYMVELARRVELSEKDTLEKLLQKNWRPDFMMKDFSSITGKPLQKDADKKVTWPVLFMYPLLPETQAIYGVGLETVDHLASTLQQAQRNFKPVVSPVFNLYEGAQAYIILQEVNRPQSRTTPGYNFFGSTMMAMLLIKNNELLPALSKENGREKIHIAAYMKSPGKEDNLLFRQRPESVSQIERALLPTLKKQIKIDNHTQPVTIEFERQISCPDVFTRDNLIMLFLLTVALLYGTRTLIRQNRHFKQEAQI